MDITPIQRAIAARYLAGSIKEGHWLSLLHFASLPNGYPSSTTQGHFRGIGALQRVCAELHKETTGKDLNLLSARQSYDQGRQIQHPYLKADTTEVIYDFPAAYNHLNDLLKYHKTFHAPPKYAPGELEKVGLINCIHTGVHSEKNLVKAITWFKSKRIDRLIIAGDLMDCISMTHSGYRRNIRPRQWVPLKTELGIAKAILHVLAESFPLINLISGNHPDRPRKFFTDALGPELSFLAMYDVLALLVGHTFRHTGDEFEIEKLAFPNINLHSLRDKAGNDISWLFPFGDAVICHAEEASSVEMKSVVNLSEKLDRWKRELPIDQDWNVIFLAHTHFAGRMSIGSGRVLVETGCLCKNQQYALEGTIKYRRPQTNCANYFEQVNGVTNINSIEQLIFPENE